MSLKKVNVLFSAIVFGLLCSNVYAENPFKPKEKIVNTQQNNPGYDPMMHDPAAMGYPAFNNFNQQGTDMGIQEVEEEIEEEEILTPEEIWEDYKEELTFVGTLNGEKIYKNDDSEYIYEKAYLYKLNKEYESKLKEIEEKNKEVN